MKRRFLLIIFMGILPRLYAASIDSINTALSKNPSAEIKVALYEKAAGYWIAHQNADSVNANISRYLNAAAQVGDDTLAAKLLKATNMLFAIGAIPQATQLNEKYLSAFSQHNNKLGIATVYYNIGHAQLLQGDLAKAQLSFQKAEDAGKNFPGINILIAPDLGNVYAEEGKYNEGLQVLQTALAQADSIKMPNEYAGLLHTIGNIYGEIGDPQTALSYFFRVAALVKLSNSMGYANTLINIAAAYNDLNETDKAEKYANEALAIVDNEASPDRVADVLYTLSEIEMKKKNYDKAQQIYDRLSKIDSITGNPLTLLMTDIGNARILFARNKYPESQKMLIAAMPLIQQNGALSDIATSYELLYKNYEQLGDYHNAFDALKKYNTIRDSITNDDKVKQLALLQARFEYQKKEIIFQKEQHIKNIALASLSIIFCLAILLAIFIFKNRQRLNTQKQMVLDAQLKKTAHDLDLSKVQLNDFALSIHEKNKLVEELQQQILLQPSPDNNLLEQLQKATILTEDEWEHFRQLFEQVHSGFLRRLKEKYPNISNAGIRFLTLAKLGFSTKEMAGSLGVSPQSIRTNWYRIRKTVDIKEDVSIEAFVATI